MAATPLTVVATDAWEQALFDSESRYFEAAAESMPLFGGTLSSMRGLTHLPAGCILHGLTTEPAWGDDAGWLRTLEAHFSAAGSRLCRFYLPAGTGHLHQLLLGAAYHPVRELGMIRELHDDTRADAIGANLVPIDSEADWREKIALYRAAGKGPDGHNMQDGLYAELEQAKCRTGYMRGYLYRRDGRTAATASLSVHDGFARLKNVLVGPSFRNQGVGRAMVRALMREGRRLGARRCGCFVSSKAALKVYRECGMWDMCFHTEWSRRL